MVASDHSELDGPIGGKNRKYIYVHFAREKGLWGVTVHLVTVIG